MAFERYDISPRRPDDARPGNTDGDYGIRQDLAPAELEPQEYLRRRNVCRDVRRHLRHEAPLWSAAAVNADRAAPVRFSLKQGW